MFSHEVWRLIVKIVKGEVNQVQVSMTTATEGVKDNQRQVTYHTHKFILGDASYTYKRAGSALNIADGNVLSLAVGMFGVSKIYNHATGEFSHHQPIVNMFMLLFLSAIMLVVWQWAVSDLFYSYVSSDFHQLPIVAFIFTLIIGFILVMKSFNTFRLLKT